MSSFFSTKIFKNFSCVHRQWRAESHCRFLHGYAREFHFQFAAKELTPEMWVMDFGGLKVVRAFLEHYFDHTFLAAEDDPELPRFREWNELGLIQLRVLANPGMEGTAKFVYHEVNKIIQEKTQGRVWINRVEIKENEHNSAIFIP